MTFFLMAREMELGDQRAYPRGQLLETMRQHVLAMRTETRPPLTGDVVRYSKHLYTDADYTGREDVIHVALSEAMRISRRAANAYVGHTVPLFVDPLIPAVGTSGASHSSPLPYLSREGLWTFWSAC